MSKNAVSEFLLRSLIIRCLAYYCKLFRWCCQRHTSRTINLLLFYRRRHYSSS